MKNSLLITDVLNPTSELQEYVGYIRGKLSIVDILQGLMVGQDK